MAVFAAASPNITAAVAPVQTMPGMLWSALRAVAEKPSEGADLKMTHTSVWVTGRDLPARMKKGTPEATVRVVSCDVKDSANGALDHRIHGSSVP